MNRPIKILLLVAVYLLAGNNAASLASPSDYRSLHFNKAEQSRVISPFSSGDPLALPDSRRRSRGVHELNPISDIELVELQREVAKIAPADGSIRWKTISPFLGTRNVTLLLQRKKLIYPFHFYF